jgi:hypothetical protein
MVGQEWEVERGCAALCPLLKSAREGLAFTPVQADELLGQFEELERNREQAVALTG